MRGKNVGFLGQGGESSNGEKQRDRGFNQEGMLTRFAKLLDMRWKKKRGVKADFSAVGLSKPNNEVTIY